uniref:Countin-1-like n=1 Tax=Crassostrea virginica TaxID=6565 RepID=A0A8B8DN14_CRAVI|nr:countin-1-like [Crassostrea virginica]
MKGTALVICGLLLSEAFAVSILNETPVNTHADTHQKIAYFRQVTRISPQAAKVGVDLCPTCINFTGQAIDMLLNIILQSGVVGSCGALCSLLEQKTGSQALGAVCNILCDIVGIEEFIKLVQEADLDPIYFCELLKACPIKDDGDAKITSFTVSPTSGPQGTFQIDLEFESKNGTGTGELILECQTVDHIPVEGGFLAEPQPAGQYSKLFNLKAEPNPDCDPTQGPCEQWLPGNYTVKIFICNGECGSKHPHSQIYDTAETSFTITQ